MTQGLFSAVSGIRVNQTRLDVISDNIANLNTIAFKGSTVNFQTVFSRNISGATAPVGSLGGINPKQIGLGVDISDIGRDFGQGNVQSTGKTSDVNIQGDGFFVLEDGNAATTGSGGVLFTRAGNFQLDANGVMVTSRGLRVVGTTNLTSTNTTAKNYVQIPQKLNIVEGTNASGDLTVTINIAQSNTKDYALTTYSIGNDGSITATYANGSRISVTTNNATPPQRELIYYPGSGGSGITPTVTAGINAYNLQMQCARFTNNSGLASLGGNIFTKTVNSGDPAYTIGDGGGVGLVNSGGLETSNVDLTKEFSNLMLSQRGLEACGRAFDTNNTILQTIVNLGR